MSVVIAFETLGPVQRDERDVPIAFDKDVGLAHVCPLSVLRTGALGPRFVASRDTRLAATSLMSRGA